MRVLVIGGTGNISTAITRELIAQGAQVFVYNRGLTQPELSGSYGIIQGDRYDHAAFEAQMAEAGRFDCVIDMIGYAPEDVRSLVRAFAGRTAQVVFCSTVDVFTKPAARYPVTEETERKPSPAFPYAYDKAICESILERATEEGHFALTIIRPAQTYSDSHCPIPLVGPGPHFLRRVREGRPVIILSDGTSFWVASHRDDVGPTFAKAVGNAAAYGRSYNVTGDEWMTWERMYGAVAEVMGAPPPDLVRIPTDLLARMAPKSTDWCVVNFRHNNLFDNAAAKADLDYAYTIPWAEGVRRMVAWHDARGAIDGAPVHPLYERIVATWRELGDRAAEAMAGQDP